MRPYQFYDVHRRFLGQSKSKIVVPFYKEIHEILVKNYCADWKKRTKFTTEKKKVVFPENRYEVLPQEEVPETSFPPESDGEYVRLTPRRCRVPRHFGDEGAFGTRRVENAPAVRSRELVLRLHVVVCALQERRLRNKSLMREKIMKILGHMVACQQPTPVACENHPGFAGFMPSWDEKIEAQMDEEVVVDKRSNVITMNTAGQETAQPIPVVVNDFWSKVSTTDTLHKYDEFANRWHVLKTGTWDSSQVNGTNLFEISLPFDFLADNKSSPNIIPFAQYAYWKGDISVRIHLNTNVLNVGRLIVSWYYGQSFDSLNLNRSNLYSCVQLPHVFIDASESNDIVFNIPFRSYKSMLSMYKRANDDNYGSLGVLRMHVFNKLFVSPSDTTTQIPYVTYVSFPNSSFSGLIPRDDSKFTKEAIEPQMFPLMKAKKIVNLASDAMDMLIPDPSRDNPPVVVRPTFVAPVPASNWASGDMDVDFVNTLRLQPAGQTPHPIGSTNLQDEMQISDIVSRWGFIDTVVWNTSHESGQEIGTFNAAPLQTTYGDINIKQGDLTRSCYVYAPVHMMSRFFSFWRGSLELRMDVVSSPFQVGSIIIGYCPRQSYNFADIKGSAIDTIKSMYNATIDIEHCKSFVFKIPYIADKPWWPTYKKIDDTGKLTLIDPPGKVYCYVLNPLVVNRSAVSDSVHLNFFLRAAPDFELSVLCNPRLGLSFNISNSTNNLISVKVDPAYAKEFAAGVWRYTGSTALVFRYGDGSDHITQFINLQPQRIYKLQSGLVLPDMAYQYFNGTKMVAASGKLRFLVRFFVNGDRDKFVYGAPFATMSMAQTFIDHNPADPYADSNTSYMLHKYIDDYVKLADDATDGVWSEAVESISGVEPQMDEVIVLDPSSGSSTSTGSGRLTFGERVDTIKSIARRYQLYKTYSFTPDVLISTNSLSGGFLVPILPGGLDLDVKNYVENLSREGVIGTLCSAYRFFRGGLRFRFVFKSDVVGMVYVQHIFDQELGDNKIKTITKGVNTSHMLQPGYAYTAQNLAINNTISVEVPFYLPTNLGLLQPTTSAVESVESVIKSLGYFYVLYQLPAIIKTHVVSCDILYSFADDMSLSCFIGFPPVFEVSTIEDAIKSEVDEFEVIEPQMGLWSDSKILSVSSSEGKDFVAALKSLVDLTKHAVVSEGAKKGCLVVLQKMGTVCASDTKFGDFCAAYIDDRLFKRQKKYDFPVKMSDKDHVNYLYKKFLKQKSVTAPASLVEETGDAAAASVSWSHKTFREKLDYKINEKINNLSSSIVKDSKAAVVDVLEQQDASIWDYIKSIAEIVGGDVKHLIFSSFTHVMHILVNPSLKTFAIAIIGVLLSLGLICTSVVSKLISLFCNAYKSVFDIFSRWSRSSGKEAAAPVSPAKTEIGHEEEIIQAQADDELSLSTQDKSALLATLIAGVTGVVASGSKISTNSLPDFTSGLFTGISNTSRACNQLTIFFKNNLEMFSKVLRHVTHKLFPRKALQLTLDDEKDYFKAWVEDCTELLHPDYTDAIMTDPKMNVRVYQAAVVAEAYKLKFQLSDVRPNPIFTSTCNKIIELRDKLAVCKISPPVRFEPWVLCVSGDSNIGKSHMAERITNELLEAINYRSYGEKIFTRTPANPYWNGCRSQPVVLYDDFLQIATAEARAQDMAELFCLKSKAVFNPPQAAIEDKHIRYNPLIVMLMCNDSHPHVSQVSSQEAWMRRRDYLIDATKLPKFKNVHPRDIDPDVSGDYGHINFNVYASSTNKLDGFSKTNITFKELLEDIKTKFLNFYHQELRQYNDRLSAATRFIPDVNESIEQTIERYKKHLELINVNNKIKDAHLIFNNVEYKDNMIPDFLRRNVIEPQMADETPVEVPCTAVPPPDPTVPPPLSSATVQTVLAQVHAPPPNTKVCGTHWREGLCFHHQFRTNWNYTNDFPTLYHSFTNKLLPGLAAKYGPAFSAFYNDSNLDMFIPDADCDSSTCCWKLNDRKIEHDMMRSWKQKNMGIFMRQDQLVKDGEKAIIIPKYFRATETSTTQLAHTEMMKRLEEMTTHMMKNFKSEIVEQAEKKGIKYRLLKTGKWILKQVIRVVKFALFIVATQAVASFIGNKLNIYPYDNETRKVVNDYVTSTGSASRNVKISERINNFFTSAPKAVEGQMAYDLKVPAAAKNLILPKSAIVPQMANDVENALVSSLTRNSFFLNYYNTSGGVRTMRCLGLFERVALIVDHYHHAYNSENYPTVSLSILGVEQVINYSDIRFLPISQSSFICIQLPKHIPPFKDIRNRFINSSSTANILHSCRVYELTNDRHPVVFTHCLPLTIRKELDIPSVVGAAPTSLSGVYQYPLSKKGLCGAVVATETPCSNPIIGIHVAGTKCGKKGFAEPIVRETIDNIYDAVMNPVSVVDVVEPQLGPTSESRLKFDYNVRLLGVVPRKLAFSCSSKSSQVHTTCYNKITQSTYDFPVLTPHDPRIAANPFSPMLVGCSYHCMNPIPFKHGQLMIVKDYLQNLYNSSVLPIRDQVGPLTREQSICGILGSPFYCSLEFSTSEGFPFSSSRPKGATDKRWLFDLEQVAEGWKLNGLDSSLASVLDCKDTMRQRGIVPNTIFTDCLKDIKLPASKCLVPGKTRIFSISPVDFTIQCRQYFLDFAVAFQEARFSADHAIGVDCNSHQWTELAQSLLNISNNIVVADYTKFGPTLMASCVSSAFDVMIDWYKYHGDDDPKHELIRRVMCEETVFSKHLLYNLVYQVNCGSPSGHPLTTILNSIVNEMYILYVFLDLGFTTSEFKSHVKLITYGDDLIMSVSDEFISRFNCVTIAKCLSKFSIVLTDASKTNDVVISRSLLDPDVTFLKRKFVPHPYRHGVYLASLDLLAVYEVCNWTFRGGDLTQKSVESCLAMLENAFGLGRGEYERLRRLVLLWWSKRRVHIVIPTWFEVDSRCFGYGDSLNHDSQFISGLL